MQHRDDKRLEIFSSKVFVWTLSFIVLLLFLNGCSENPAEPVALKGKRTSASLPVTVTTVERKDVPVELRSVGLIEASVSIAIKSQVSGLLEKVAFQEGDLVKAGDLLFQIDPRPYRSRLKQAQAALTKDLAALDNARKQAKRYLPAAEKGYVSSEQSDQAQTTAATLEAQIIADEAALENARLDLENCTIRSPIAGYTGELFTDSGNLVKAAADQPLVTINQITPVKISFTLPELALTDVKKYRTAGEMDVRAESGDESFSGKLIFVDNRVDPASGTIRLKASFPNKKNQLWPGQFVSVWLRLATRTDAIVVPTRAIQTSQNGDFVYVVNSDQTVTQRPITLAFTAEDQAIIDVGLSGGETIVTDGHLRLRDGAAIKVLETDTPKAAPGDEK